MAIELKDIINKWMYITIQELKESGFWTKDFEDNQQTYSDEWITKAINLSSVKINDWTGGFIGYADNINNLTEEQQIGVKWATAIYTLHWLSKGTEYLLQATTFSQGSQSYNINTPQDMQFVPDEVQKILINAGLYENIRFANLKEKDKSWFSNGWRYEFDEGSGYASFDWVRNNYIANFNITSSDNSILINFINRLDGIPQKLNLVVNPNIKIKIDNKSIIYNANNELSVPFDNESIINKNGIWSVSDNYALKNEIKKWIKVDTPDFNPNSSKSYIFSYDFKDKIIRIRIKGGSVGKEVWSGWLELLLNESSGKYNLPLLIGNDSAFFNLKIELAKLETAIITLDSNIIVNIQDIKIESWE
ncbi:hypothetical protein [Spiroplasma endosymbiont of Stenodema calcarata]|uniref:hypothetical protein n=1 Tax=Spiroplasma endosymbiont of Stenodema calcarata TaxID=3139328 RepID=UPI003CCB27E9